ncbi:LIM domain-binding protein 3 isoform X5 [Anopheles gambiae]|uniref:LIM domain-binding protein 3 isoform X4 n=1 Tax=Anopheles coluzzii TaxID=1518534 RepID=UPI0020FFBAD8|nr:LIM domain-binding protein 3 isoform X4 [Anopheles coluzzii]XP_061519417.1 LIM domain-binding protein 3 isoform X5 [Anopheles gambiae]XP_061519418.1 LIM domain-binding protein 3 isoform X5 [Anopheles gambiae]
MSPKPHDFTVTLRRSSPQVAWGIRLAGGTDLNAPLIITRVQDHSPAQPELLRGDVITKIDQYDARDLMHIDAQNLFRNAGNQIKVTVRRDDKVALHQSAHPINGNPVAPLSPANFAQPYQPYAEPGQPAKPQLHQNFPPPDPTQLLPSTATSLPHGPQSYAAALERPVETLPHTVFPGVDGTGAYHLPKQPYPPPAPTSLNDANEAITNQPYRTTPLVLPGAKVPKKDTLPTESYLRHHPNPAMRAPPAHDYTDSLMKQKLAETVIHRVIGEEPPSGPKVVHKQFNSPIGLYSDNNIENTIRQSAPQQTQTVPIFIDLSFLKQKQKILDEQRRLEQERQQQKQYPFQSYSSCSSGRTSRQQTVSPPPPVPPLPDSYHMVVDPASAVGHRYHQPDLQQP